MASLRLLLLATNTISPHLSQTLGSRRRRPKHTAAVSRPRSSFLCQSRLPAEPPAGDDGGGGGKTKKKRAWWVVMPERLQGGVVKAGMALHENLRPKQKGDWKDVALMSFSFAIYVYISQRIVCTYCAWVSMINH